MSTILYFDGGKKPDNITYGFVIYHNEEIIFSCGGSLGDLKVSSNVAEYSALLLGLIKCLELGFKEITIRGDSLLIINQIQGICRTKNQFLKQFHRMIKNIIRTNDILVKFDWIPREHNYLSDRLNNI